MEPTAHQRIGWADLPEHARAAFTREFTTVVGEDRKLGGYSPGLASVLHMEDGRSVFVKGINAARTPGGPDLYRRERDVMGVLPAGLPAPALLWHFDDGDWVLLAFTAVEGRTPRIPWRADDLNLVVTALADMAEWCTPSDAPVVSAVEDIGADGFHTHWRDLVSGTLHADVELLPPWARENLHLLAELEEGWEKGADGDTLLHMDLRSDNILITSGGVEFVDWPWAAKGTAWLDMAQFLPTAVPQGVDAEAVWRDFPPGRDADPTAVNRVLAGIAGGYLVGAQKPAPPGIPHLRDDGYRWGEAALDWLRARL
ncbi:hypothetical protein ACWFMI_24625 [Nocardiopsis terrae]|uniref:aminoglycoside phosphotransferase family protein n=1 Tax=Streptomyces sp. NPDC057554 TaxID=3350538 RepID=UPI0036BBA68F